MSGASPQRGADVFVSYSSHDRERVLQIVEHLRAAGVSVWIDVDKIDGATKWAAEIVHAIEACKLVLLMCSDASMRSWAVTQEIQIAGANQKYLLPLMLEHSSFPAQIRFFLTGVQWIEILDKPSGVWQPRILRAFQRVGIACEQVAGEGTPGDRTTQPSRLEWSLEGLRSVARFTDQLWVAPADAAMPQAGRSLLRGLGEAQASARHSFPLGSEVRIGIEAEHDGYLLLLDEGPENKTYCLCPSHFARGRRLRMGTRVLPDSNPYHAFVLTGIPGREQLLAIVSDEPLVFDWMPADGENPARILKPDDIDALFRALESLPPGSWTALATYFDVVAGE
jgi:hypothetical protein